MDRGANGRVAGSDGRVIETHTDRKVDIRGIDNHEINAITLVTTLGVTSTITSEVVLIMHQHSCYGKSKTMDSSPHIENYKNMLDNRSIKVRG